ncbi:MAG: maltose alpha-D-glucosyltransferase, partial [Actinomycetota bacterium]
FYPSPLRDDGYDIANYEDIHPSYGTLADFDQLIGAAHQRGLKVITELVINHTSDQHPWFQAARRAPVGACERDYYVWSETNRKYEGVRIIFTDTEISNWSWDDTAKAYYWHRFFHHQPDLNFDNPQVLADVNRVMQFWLDRGVDGLRLDAVPYLIEREGTTCENLEETHDVLRKVRKALDGRYPDRLLLAEANQWPADVRPYFGDGDECHMAFHFPLMPRMFMALRQEDRFPIIDILSQTPPTPASSQWALFLRNHDELTLEMVTDEDRDYMYRVYAHDPQARINLGIRRRLAPLLGNNRRMIETMNALLVSLPGTPVIYYGDEIGMGDNIYLGDRNGVRTPMQWSPDRNAGFSDCNPQRLYLPVNIDPEYHYEALNVEAQQSNPHSLLWYTKRLVALRKRYQAFGRGSLEFLYPENRKILAFIRSYHHERILVVVNLSRFAQHVELDLSAARGATPVELFGGTEFPPVGDRSYLLTLGPHSFYWFALRPQRAEVAVSAPTSSLPLIELRDEWHAIFRKKNKGALEEVLPAFLRQRRWFGGKGRRITGVDLIDAVEVDEPGRSGLGYFTLIQVEYSEGDPDVYCLPLACTSARRAGEMEALGPAAVARLRTREGEQVLFEALWDPEFDRVLLEAVARRRRLPGMAGRVLFTPTRAFRRLRGPEEAPLQSTLMGAEQSNTSVAYADRLILKIFRRPEEGLNPDLEIGRFLTDVAGLTHTPAVAGAIEYQRGRGEPMTMGIMHAFVHNEGDAWRYTLDTLSRFVERVLVNHRHGEDVPLPVRPRLLDLADTEPPVIAHEVIGGYLQSARLIGERTAQLHVALASNHEDAAFAPEPFSPFYQRSLFESMRSLNAKVFRFVHGRAAEIAELKQVQDLEADIAKRFRSLLDLKITAMRIRCHGDYHLGQVLYTGKDFLIIDFEGEPARRLSERRLKRSPLQDVAGMLRSFHYAGYSALFGRTGGFVRPEDRHVLQPWLHFWYLWVSASFLRSYLHTAGDATFLPKARGELEVLLDAFLLEKAVYELGYEINNRPEWVQVPVQGIVELMES